MTEKPEEFNEGLDTKPFDELGEDSSRPSQDQRKRRTRNGIFILAIVLLLLAAAVLTFMAYALAQLVSEYIGYGEKVDRDTVFIGIQKRDELSAGAVIGVVLGILLLLAFVSFIMWIFSRSVNNLAASRQRHH